MPGCAVELLPNNRRVCFLSQPVFGRAMSRAASGLLLGSHSQKKKRSVYLSFFFFIVRGNHENGPRTPHTLLQPLCLCVQKLNIIWIRRLLLWGGVGGGCRSQISSFCRTPVSSKLFLFPWKDKFLVCLFPGMTPTGRGPQMSRVAAEHKRHFSSQVETRRKKQNQAWRPGRARGGESALIFSRQGN